MELHGKEVKRGDKIYNKVSKELGYLFFCNEQKVKVTKRVWGGWTIAWETRDCNKWEE